MARPSTRPVRTTLWYGTSANMDTRCWARALGGVELIESGVVPNQYAKVKLYWDFIEIYTNTYAFPQQFTFLLSV